MRNAVVGGVVAVLVLFVSGTCQAERRGLFRRSAEPLPAAEAATTAHVQYVHPGPQRYSADQARAAYARQVYPQYYWGFHARHDQNLGVPTGDIGLRGNGITWQPW
jgi:hypothetical protein